MRPWEDALRREAEEKTRHIGPDSRVRNAVTASENDDYAAMPQKRGLFAKAKTQDTAARNSNGGTGDDGATGEKTLRGVLLRHKKSFAAAASALALAAVLAVTMIAGLWKGGAGDPLPQEKLVSACTLEINPAVMFLVDENQQVTAVKALNADADVLLSEEGTADAMIGKPLSEAAVAYADRAFRLGYIDPEKTENAVRLSHTETAGDTATVAQALRGYFCEKGIFSAVLEKTLDKASLSTLVGADGDLSVRELSEKVTGLSALYGERSLAGRSAEELKAEYRTKVEETYLYSLTLARLAENAARLNRCATLLLRISDLNTQIMFHDGNPMLLLKDYWSVRDSRKTSEDEEFNALMRETEQALANYETAGGRAIGSFSELRETASDYAALQERYGNIQEIVSSLPATQFYKYAPSLIGILRSAGVDVSRLETLLSIPATAEEFIERLRLSLADTAGQRLADYAAAYGTARDPLSEEDYNARLARLTEKYGSLEDFWAQSHPDA